MRLPMAMVGFLTLASCHNAQSPAPVGAGARVPAQNCAVIESRDWSAWVNRMPGTAATLHVEGQIDLPTPGYTTVLREGAADRSAVPRQQIILELSPPSGMVSQVVTAETVRYEGPALAAHYRSVAMMCDGQRIAEITDVLDVQ